MAAHPPTAAPATTGPAASDVEAWRPQRFASGNVKHVVDPLIEPLWEGARVLVRVGLEPSAAAGGQPQLAGGLPAVSIVDASGRPVEDLPEIAEAIAVAARASSLVLDGYLTGQATRSSVGAVSLGPAAPTAADMAAQLLLGSAGRRRRQEIARQHAATAGLGPLAFVAVDLLLVDGESLLDVPLLERKRILEGVLGEAELVRRTAFVRPPVDPWIGTWRGLGFASLAYKAANSRYLPGQPNPDWATAAIPQR